MAFTIDKDAWYTSQEVADLGGVGLKTLEAERHKGGGIPYSRIGRRIYHKGADVEAYLSGRRQISTSDRPVNPGVPSIPKRAPVPVA